MIIKLCRLGFFLILLAHLTGCGLKFVGDFGLQVKNKISAFILLRGWIMRRIGWIQKIFRIVNGTFSTCTVFIGHALRWLQ